MRSLSLTKDEKHVLYYKYRMQGLTSQECNDRLDICTKYLSNLVKKLCSQNKSEKYIADRFKQEFEKICMKLEV